MFREINDVKQEPAGRRRWFEADGIELVVWLGEEPANDVTGFQLCYEFRGREYALTWRADAGFTHSKVDTGDGTPLRNETPVLEPDQSIPWALITQRFDANSRSLEPWLSQVIRRTLHNRTGTAPQR